MISYDCLLAGGTIRRDGVAKHCRAGKFKQRTRENEKLESVQGSCNLVVKDAERWWKDDQARWFTDEEAGATRVRLVL